ncbi:MAG: HutD family protein [Bacteroidales bacterium]|nr:HutD family protein [Bacteroidales bacterium]
MITEHIKASDLNTNKWSGGTTTQLAIYPKDADYKKLNFQFRISTATVEVEESTFTKLPGIYRKLMILDGEIRIEHKDRYTQTLKKFEQDSFEGNWNTKSFGKAVDFNLMTKGNTKGEIESLIIKNKFTLIQILIFMDYMFIQEKLT